MNTLLRISSLTIRSALLPTSAQSLLGSPSSLFHSSPCLFAEPLKKKKKLDPQIIRAREERRKKKLEKQIRRLEKNARQLKPIEECEIPRQLLDDIKTRTRKTNDISEAVMENRILLEKQWARYKNNNMLDDLQQIDKIAFSQQRALDELRLVSEDLYQEAIQINPALLPYKSVGPVNTPKVDSYEATDGEYLDITKKW